MCIEPPLPLAHPVLLPENVICTQSDSEYKVGYQFVHSDIVDEHRLSLSYLGCMANQHFIHLDING